LSVIERLFKNTVTQSRNKGRDSRAAACGANLYRTLWCHWSSRKYGAGKLRFSHTKLKKIFENFSLFGHEPLKSFVSSVLGGEIVKNIGFKGRQIINLPGVPTCLGPAL